MVFNGQLRKVCNDPFDLSGSARREKRRVPAVVNRIYVHVRQGFFERKRIITLPATRIEHGKRGLFLSVFLQGVKQLRNNGRIKSVIENEAPAFKKRPVIFYFTLVLMGDQVQVSFG